MKEDPTALLFGSSCFFFNFVAATGGPGRVTRSRMLCPPLGLDFANPVASMAFYVSGLTSSYW